MPRYLEGEGACSPDDIVPLRPKQAAKLKYPPGCCVLVCSYQEELVKAVLPGTIRNAGINLDSRETIYDVEIAEMNLLVLHPRHGAYQVHNVPQMPVEARAVMGV